MQRPVGMKNWNCGRGCSIHTSGKNKQKYAKMENITSLMGIWAANTQSAAKHRRCIQWGTARILGLQWSLLFFFFYEIFQFCTFFCLSSKEKIFLLLLLLLLKMSHTDDGIYRKVCIFASSSCQWMWRPSPANSKKDKKKKVPQGMFFFSSWIRSLFIGSLVQVCCSRIYLIRQWKARKLRDGQQGLSAGIQLWMEWE